MEFTVGICGDSSPIGHQIEGSSTASGFCIPLQGAGDIDGQQSEQLDVSGSAHDMTRCSLISVLLMLINFNKKEFKRIRKLDEECDSSRICYQGITTPLQRLLCDLDSYLLTATWRLAMIWILCLASGPASSDKAS